MFRILILVLTGIALLSCNNSETINICYDKGSETLAYGIAKIENTLKSTGYEINYCEDHNSHVKGIISFNLSDQSVDWSHNKKDVSIETGGYSMHVENKSIKILSKDDRGALYGIMDLIEQLDQTKDIKKIQETHVNPAFSFRAIKFNLPWSPYRPGPATDVHTERCKDLKFWEAFLDMMVANRFNALTLWNAHPFPFMIRATNYPKATPFDDAELNEWKLLWKTLFKMAKDRGIETYILNWNIVVSPEFAKAYDAKIHFDQSELVKEYTRESVTQVINEYENLTGIGVTLADWMGNWGEEKMTPKEREDWIQDTFVEGMKAANRKVKFIHRAVLAGGPKEMRQVINYADLPDKTNVEVKFNWSHGHSTPNLSITHSNDAGTIMRDFWDPMPENYFISWMIRNEDFFVLRWGDPDFIRSHINTNHHEYVDGYFIGSEGYIPAVDYSHMDLPGKTWKYAFEKQWMYYHLWGRLLYNPSETNKTLAFNIKKRYPDVDALQLLNAYSLASRVPQSIASFYKGTWDFTLYSEGFLAPWQNGFDDGKSPFISLEEMIQHETLDSRYLSIQDYCTFKKGGEKINPILITPLELAEEILKNGRELESIIADIKGTSTDPTLQSELHDLATWCYLGYYFADKIKAAVAFQNHLFSREYKDKEAAAVHLENCISHWNEIVKLTEDRYKSMPYVSMGHHEQKWPEFKEFHWKNFISDVEADLEFVIKAR